MGRQAFLQDGFDDLLALHGLGMSVRRTRWKAKWQPVQLAHHGGGTGGTECAKRNEAGTRQRQHLDDRHRKRTARGRLPLVSDTSPKANARYFELLRQAGPERRLEICLVLSRATRELAIAGIKQAHPDRFLSDDELRQKLAERLYGAEVARRVFAGRAA
jgi:hypothetical protein